jgi:hypothetical protein
MQIGVLDAKLGDLHATDANALRRAHHSLTQHIATLVVEVRDAQAAAKLLDGQKGVFTGEACAREVQP